MTDTTFWCDFCCFRWPMSDEGGVIGTKRYCVRCGDRAQAMWEGRSAPPKHIAVERELYIRDWSQSGSEPLACRAMQELLQEIDYLRDLVFEATLKPTPVRDESRKPLKNEQVLALYDAGFADGLRAYANWRDGIQYVGTCGQTLMEALGKRRTCWSYGTTDLTDVMEKAR